MTFLINRPGPKRNIADLDAREHDSLEDKEAKYNESMENVRYKTGTYSGRDVDPEDVGEDYGLVKGEALPKTYSSPTNVEDPRHTAMRALIATVVATGCTCSRCERLRQYVPNIGRRTLKQDTASYENNYAKIKKSKKQRSKKVSPNEEPSGKEETTNFQP